MTPQFFAPKTIPGAPWIYPENLKAIVAAIPEL